VNFPEVKDGCSQVSDFRWVLSRINLAILSPEDLDWCSSHRLPAENDVLKKGCYISVSIGNARDKTTMNDVTKQKEVAEKLKDLLVCLPK
jgi:hypothetical protein